MYKKRIKLGTSIQSDSSSLDNGIESDFTNSASDFSLPPVRRKVLGTRQVSFSIENKLSFDSLELQQTSSGYGSLLSSSSSLSPHKSLSLTPKKRKSENTDENAFYNSYQFVSPSKNRKTEEKRAKLTLHKKSASENVFSCSTPNKISKSKWGKSRSMHPDKFGTGQSLQSPVPPLLAPPAEISFECSSFDISGSFNLVESHSKDSPGNLQQLLIGEIVVPQPSQNASPVEKVTQSQENVSGCSTNTPGPRIFYHCGRLTLDILGKLNKEQNVAFDEISSHLNEIDLLSLSHVSKDYRNMIKSNKTLEPKRQNYLKAFRKIKENQIPGNRTLPPKLKTNKKKLGKFGDSNVNHSMQLRPKTQSPPVSPSKKKFYDNQKIANSHAGPLRKCPKCCKPAFVGNIKIRSSPRKKKSNILKLSTTGGRVEKKIKTFLSKPSIESESFSDQLFVTFPNFNSDSSNCGSPSTTSSDESGCETESYKFAQCSGIACSFKFCIECLCKYHPRQRCKLFSPPSPSRSSVNKSSIACSNKSLKSLKRLFN